MSPPVRAHAPWMQWALLLTATLGLAATLAMIQVILSHYTWRLDLTPEKRFTLSEHARQVLKNLDHDVHVIAFLRSDDARNSEIEDLLTRVRNVSPRVQYSVVDVNRNPAVARQYGVDNYGSLVVESDGRRKDFASPREDVLVEAILQVTRPHRKVVYFLSGHGEPDIDNTDRRLGYSGVRNALQREFYDVRSLNLLDENSVPDDATVVVVAGPRRDLLTSELAKLGDYVRRGGGLLVMLDPQAAPSLVAFLARYGITVDNDVVVDPENRLFAGDYLTLIVPGLSAQHPVSAGLKAPPLFSQARTVGFAGTPDGNVKGIDFLQTAKSGWSTTDTEVLRTGVASFVGGRDRAGPVPVGVSVLIDNRRTGDVGPGSPGVARVIVLGDSDFANNFFIDYLGDKDLVVDAINWLAGQEELVGARPQLRQPGVNQFFVSARQGRLAFTLGTIVEPALFLAVGAAIFLRRRWTG
ncbi:MAG TPA: GldG family protein [Candidatus Margulisiibacteriota bacterium]|nr:GldG family protein [Candidatus Margulisiibacteriota bacterium]